MTIIHVHIICVLQGSIYVNGDPLEGGDRMQRYISEAGYVLQLATPYYEELTVRENLILAAWMRLVNVSTQEKFQRVDNVMDTVSTY